MSSRSVPVIQAELADVCRYLVDVPPHSGQGLRDDLHARVNALERELDRARTAAAPASTPGPLTQAQVAAYLTRIGHPMVEAPTAEGLASLHRAHVTTVPFENLDIVDGVPIDLSLDALFDKVVTRRRGGFCYELNGLFAALLRSLGHDVTLVAASTDPDGTPHEAFDHVRLLVGDERDGRWLADVGNGASWPSPLPLTDGATQDLGHAQVRLRHDVDGWHTQTRGAEADDWELEWRFDEEPRTLADFAARCRWQESDPASHFAQGLICTRTIQGGKLSLTADRLIVTIGAEREEQPVDDPEVALLQHFGIRRPASR